MPLRFGIPVTLILMLVVSAASSAAGFNLYYVLVGATALWMGYDSWRLELRRYRTRLAVDPVVLTLLSSLLWPVVFPWYLRVRHRIRGEEIPEGPYPHASRTAVAVALVCVFAAFAFGQYATRDIRPLAEAIAEEYEVPLSLTLRENRYLDLSLRSDAVQPDINRREFAEGVARFAYERYRGKKPLFAVTVKFITTDTRGAAEITTVENEYRWFSGEL